MEDIKLLASSTCHFCNKMKMAVLINNLNLPVNKEIEIAYDDVGDPNIQKAVQEFGNLVPFPMIFKEGKIREVVTGVYSDIDDNFIVINSLLKGG